MFDSMKMIARAWGPLASCGLLLFAMQSIRAEVAAEVQEAVLRGQWAKVVSRSDDATGGDLLDKVRTLRLRALAEEQLGKISDASATLDRAGRELTALSQPSKGKPGLSVDKSLVNSEREWLSLDRARLMLSDSKKRNSGFAALDELTRQSGADASAAALYLLAVERNKDKKIDAAAMAFNLSREAFPNAVGEDQLVELFAGPDGEDSSSSSKNGDKTADDSATRVTNTRYSIQLGVFANRANADAILTRVATKRYAGGIEKKIVSGNTYFAALIGSFLSLGEAQRVRDSLEQVYDASYTVITR